MRDDTKLVQNSGQWKISNRWENPLHYSSHLISNSHGKNFDHLSLIESNELQTLKVYLMSKIFAIVLKTLWLVFMIKRMLLLPILNTRQFQQEDILTQVNYNYCIKSCHNYATEKGAFLLPLQHLTFLSLFCTTYSIIHTYVNPRYPLPDSWIQLLFYLPPP